MQPKSEIKLDPFKDKIESQSKPPLTQPLLASAHIEIKNKIITSLMLCIF